MLARANDALRLRLVQAIVEKDGPAQAMLMLEELLEGVEYVLLLLDDEDDELLLEGVEYVLLLLLEELLS